MPLIRPLLAACCIAFSGAAVMFAITLQNSEWQLVLAAAGGAFLSGSVFAHWFGLSGHAGFAKATFGAVMSTLLGAALAGLAVGLNSLGLGVVLWAPYFVVAMTFSNPIVLLVWIATMSATHLALLRIGPRLGPQV